ncbi:MAG TPA: hypothetical protein ENJ09_06120 [Planctomycetes bacterium]|nr:hypothetical protein [Planctomycetota bacterium]
MTSPALRAVLASSLALSALSFPASSQCGPEPPLGNSTGAGTVACPCFAVGESAGAVLTAPAADYPIEITKVRIGWGSVFGGAPQSLESSIDIYPAGLPNPGTPQFSLAAPIFNDGFINEFDLDLWPGNKVITSGPFTVAVKFANASAGNLTVPSIVHDGAGCQVGKNVIFAIPGGWNDACALGVTGNWVIEVDYRKAPSTTVENGSGVNPTTLAASGGPTLGQPWSLTLDCTGHAPDLALLLGHAQLAASPVLLPSGELLLDLASPRLLKRSTTHGGAPVVFNFTLPNDVSFCGLTLYSQGACFGAPSAQLSNALASRVGS